MKPLRWNADKNKQLRAERRIDFDTVALAINQGRVLDIVEHPNQEKYPSQKLFVLVINQYVYLFPFIEDENSIFLKTIIPSCKMKKKYLGG